MTIKEQRKFFFEFRKRSEWSSYGIRRLPQVHTFRQYFAKTKDWNYTLKRMNFLLIVLQETMEIRHGKSADKSKLDGYDSKVESIMRLSGFEPVRNRSNNWNVPPQLQTNNAQSRMMYRLVKQEILSLNHSNG